jgi:hypothetical protein
MVLDIHTLQAGRSLLIGDLRYQWYALAMVILLSYF